MDRDIRNGEIISVAVDSFSVLLINCCHNIA